MAVEAELRRRNLAGALADWVVVPDAENPETGVSDPVIEYRVRELLAEVLIALAGTLTVDTGLAPQTDALTDTQLRADDVPVRDDFTGELVATDQVGAGAVLTFTLGAPAFLVAVDVDPTDPTDTSVYVARARTDGTDPDVSTGWRCRAGQTTYLPVPAPSGSVKVWAPSGVSVSVQGAAR